MKEFKKIKIQDYDYDLDKNNIAYHPSKKRGESKLLFYKQGSIEHHSFGHCTELLNSNDLVVFNNSRVINARLWFQKITGKIIEVFCLEPSQMDMAEALGSNEKQEWNCYVGGAKKWKSGKLSKEIFIQDKKVLVEIEKGERVQDYFKILFSWNSEHIFSEIIEELGNIPLPPYIDRENQIEDENRYQTVYSEIDGSVAAPTAGLHFSDEIIEQLKSKSVICENITLHVGAGTFKPVNSEEIGDHSMHAEYFEVPLSFLEMLFENHDKRVIAVGTTSVRTLESLYWIAHKINNKAMEDGAIHLNQWELYENLESNLSLKEALGILIDYLTEQGKSVLIGSTELMIVPGYEFKIVQGMFTNFHLPKSTLLLLITALIGEDWKEIYDTAQKSGYTFLSYGDSSLLIP